MKENLYDDTTFFEQYSHFPRSVEGLNAAGEWHELQKLLPDFTGKRVLDIGCGFGWHCIYAVEHGASSVVGIDISCKMLQVAREKTTSPVVSYKQMAMEDMDFAPNSFDVVISSLAFHYTPNFSDICQKIANFLVPGGYFVFSVEHPIFTAYGTQDWVYAPDGTRAHWPVDTYFMEGKRCTRFLEQDVIKYHNTLTTYLNTLLYNRLSIVQIIEPQPAQHLMNTVKDMRDELRRPMMLLVATVKI